MNNKYKNCPMLGCRTECGSRGCKQTRKLHGLDDDPKITTNADRIRAMSDEELATDLLYVFQEICEDGVPKKEWMIEWLKQPAE